jgi:hypothetical protein
VNYLIEDAALDDVAIDAALGVGLTEQDGNQ